MEKEYKNKSDVELDGVLRQFIKDIEDVEKQITTLSSTDRIARADEITRIQANYARVKGALKDASHYTGLSRNANRANSFYTWSFRKAVNDASVHCRAKVNEINISKIFSSLYEAETDLKYYLLKDYQGKK